MLEILLADDEPSIRIVLRAALTDAGHRVVTVADGAEAMARLEAGRFDVVVTDINMPRADGLAVFRKARAVSAETDVILMTAHGDVADAVQALKDGALDYVTKPFDPEEIVLRVGRVAERHTLRRALSEARAKLAERARGPDLVGDSPAMTRLLDRIATIAASEATVIVTGESGTGKELVARRLHDLSPRRDKPFVAVNCAAFPDTLIEAELFGYERGAFTGAVGRRDGRFQAATGGTLFLDEVAEMPLLTQAKLLRVLQEGVVEPLGTNNSIKVDVRVVSATHRNLKTQIAERRFREDLYYRLHVLGVTLPPLRERREDLPILVEHFLRVYAPPGTRPPKVSPRAWAALMGHPFPGNVRELQHAVHHAVVLAGGAEIDLEHLPSDLGGIVVVPTHTAEAGLVPLSIAMKAFEREYLARALRARDGKKAETAELLGISRKNLWEKLRSHDLSVGDLDQER